jgi:hypothetical protein
LTEEQIQAGSAMRLMQDLPGGLDGVTQYMLQNQTGDPTDTLKRTAGKENINSFDQSSALLNSRSDRNGLNVAPLRPFDGVLPSFSVSVCDNASERESIDALYAASFTNASTSANTSTTANTSSSYNNPPCESDNFNNKNGKRIQKAAMKRIVSGVGAEDNAKCLKVISELQDSLSLHNTVLMESFAEAREGMYSDGFSQEYVDKIVLCSSSSANVK